MRIESSQKSRFIAGHLRLNAFERLLVHEKRGLHRAIVPPEPHGAQRRVIKATSVGEIKRHDQSTVSWRGPPSPSFRRPTPHEPVLPPLPRGWVPGKRGGANGD